MNEGAVDIVLTLLYIDVEFSDGCYNDFLQVLPDSASVYLFYHTLAHLSKRLIGELIICTGIRRTSFHRWSTFSKDVSSKDNMPLLIYSH